MAGYYGAAWKGAPMLKRLLEVEGRRDALWSVISRKRTVWTDTVHDRGGDVTHRIRLTRTNLIQAFAHGKDAHLRAEVIESTSHYMYRGRVNTITPDGTVIEET